MNQPAPLTSAMTLALQSANRAFAKSRFLRPKRTKRAQKDPFILVLP